MVHHTLQRFSKALAKPGAVAVLLVGLSSCSVKEYGQEVAYTGGRPGIDRPVTLDDKLAEVAERTPGFGGMFYDRAGNLNVHIVVPKGELGIQALEARKEEVKKAIVSVFGRGVLRSQMPGVGDAEMHAQGLAETKLLVRTAKYDFLTLRRWYYRLNDTFAISGVLFTDIDEMRNRLVVGVERGNVAARQEVEKELARIGMPRGMVLIEETDPIHPTATLLDSSPTKVGGLGITFNHQSDGTASVCTLGFNAVLNGVNGFVTNSHCTTTQGVVENTDYYQGKPDGTVYIGTETVDPPYYSASSCPPAPTGEALVCRWSDSSFVQYDPLVQSSLGYLARTTLPQPSPLPKYTSFTPGGENLITLDPDPATQYMKVVGETEPIAGQFFSKIGRSTGWTYSNVLAPGDGMYFVNRTCSNQKQEDPDPATPDKLFLCQFEVTAGAFGGDSGSPVFVWQSDNTVFLAGILWGSNHSVGVDKQAGTTDDFVGTLFIFSPMDLVRWELAGQAGTLHTHYTQ